MILFRKVNLIIRLWWRLANLSRRFTRKNNYNLPLIEQACGVRECEGLRGCFATKPLGPHIHASLRLAKLYKPLPLTHPQKCGWKYIGIRSNSLINNLEHRPNFFSNFFRLYSESRETFLILYSSGLNPTIMLFSFQYVIRERWYFL